MSTHAAWSPSGDLLTSTGYSPVPDHSPYQPGDWVVCHGYSGMPAGPRRWGWRGMVLGSYGATLLAGVTDDGAGWAEYWGSLTPDGAPSPDGRCACHPRAARWLAPAAEPAVEQLDIFSALPGWVAS